MHSFAANRSFPQLNARALDLSSYSLSPRLPLSSKVAEQKALVFAGPFSIAILSRPETANVTGERDLERAFRRRNIAGDLYPPEEEAVVPYSKLSRDTQVPRGSAL